MRRAHPRPGWLLLLLWVVVGALFVPPARPAPQPAHDEASRPSLSQTLDEAPVSPDRDDLLADAPSSSPEPRRLPEPALASDLTRAGPPARPLAFVLLRRPPPLVIPA